MYQSKDFVVKNKSKTSTFPAHFIKELCQSRSYCVIRNRKITRQREKSLSSQGASCSNPMTSFLQVSSQMLAVRPFLTNFHPLLLLCLISRILYK